MTTNFNSVSLEDLADAGAARTGSFLDTAQKAETDENGQWKVSRNAFRGTADMRVTNQWLRRPADERFLSLDDLYEATKAMADASYENKLATRQLTVVAPEPEAIEDTHVIRVVDDQGRITEPTHYSFGQIASLAGAPAGYLRTLPTQITSEALNYGLRWNRARDEIKLYAKQDGQLRAATGPDYGRIYDHEAVEAIRSVVASSDVQWKIPGVFDWRTQIYNPHAPVTKETTTLYANDRSMFAFLVADLDPIDIGTARNGEPDILFRGFGVSNSETGNGCLEGFSFYLRGLCENRILWGVEGVQEVSIRHSKYAPARFLELFRPALEEMASRSGDALREGVAKAKAAVIGKDNDDILDFLQARSFSRKKAVEIMEAVEREEGVHLRTVWDAVQGITAVARSMPNVDERIAVERVAGKLLDRVARAA